MATVKDFNDKVNEFKEKARLGKYHHPHKVCEELEQIVEKIQGISDHEREQLNNDAYDTGMLFWSF